jgi:hypothetical protein
LGSTEWVEQNNDIIQSNVVAYLNVDCAVGGAGFYASSSPQLDDLLMEVSKQVSMNCLLGFKRTQLMTSNKICSLEKQNLS